MGIFSKKKKLTPAAREALRNPNTLVEIDTFKGVDWYKHTKIFPAFIIYQSPEKFLGKYVVCLFDGNKPTRLMSMKDSLEEARAAVPENFVCSPRTKNDAPQIVESWI